MKTLYVRVVGLTVALMAIIAASCGSQPTPVAAITVVPTSEPAAAAATAPPVAEAAPEPTEEAVAARQPASTPVPSADDSDEAVSANSAAPLDQADELLTIDEIVDGWKPYQFTFPTLPAVVLPDLSELGEYGQRLESDLGSFIGSGLDVVTVPCSGTDNDELYVGDSGGFLDAGPGGSGTIDFFDDKGWVTYTVNEDGSGEYKSTSEPFITLEVAADGAGTYYRSSNGGEDTVRVEVDAAGHGDYTLSNDEEFVVIEIGPNESGRYRRVEDPSASRGTTLDFFVDGNGLGSYSLDTEDFSEAHSRTDTRESYRITDETTGHTLSLIIDDDGSGQLIDDARDLQIWVETDGSGSLKLGEESFDFSTDGGILDPALAMVAGETVYAVADRFPALDTLPPLEPVCATVVRIDAAVLFDFDSDQLRPEADAVLKELVDTLEGTGQEIEIHGHTDSMGDDAYNLDLSDRRAASVLIGLRDRGLEIGASTMGFGESRPIAANETVDGRDNPAGRQLNRRVEIILRGSN